MSRFMTAVLLLFGLAATGFAQDKSADEVARELANPNNALASLTFKNQLRWYEGDLPGADDQGNYTLLFQPTFPFPMADTASGGKANFFVRPAFPFIFNQPMFNGSSGDFAAAENGLGDIGFDVGYGVTEKSGLLWALGMVGTLPTATNNNISGKQLRLGPEVLLAMFKKWGVVGIWPSHQWNVTGWDDTKFNVTQIQAFFTYLPGGGWAVGSTPIMNYSWESEDWTFPLNFTFGRTIKAGKLPVKLQFEMNYYVVHPDAFGPQWMIGFNVTPVIPNFVNSWIRGK